jgi:hypothetical protein
MSNNSPAPAVKQTGYKAYAATAVSFLATFAGVWIADTAPFTAKEAVGGLITAAIASGLSGGATYFIRNKPTA